MKDLIQEAAPEVSIVIYDAPLPPRYFRFSKRFIKVFFVVVPLCLVGLVLFCFLWGLGERVKATPGPNFPKVLTEQDSKVLTLENEIKGLRQSNTELAEKLSSQPSATTPEDPYLMGIKKPYGMQNLLSQNRVSLDQFELVQESNIISLKFQIISGSPETKVTGHVIVFMVSETGMMAYPAEANLTIDQGIKFSQGEPFSVSRLRPTNAQFLTHPVGESVRFVIYIFSREGDLLHIKETESFKVKAKS